MFCFHDRLKEFTFQDGTHIKCCPDCTQFDTKRREVLRTGQVEMVQTKQEIHWGLLLEEAGLDVDNDGLDSWLNYMGDTFGTLKAIVDDRQRQKIRPRTHLDDVEWNERQRPFPHTQSMPRHFNAYCAHCIDVVVNHSHNKVRTQKGVYLPIEHDCASVRVYNLQGTLIEVMAI